MAWDACLKITKVNLETITDPTMYMMLEQGIRGGISVITKRHAKANNNLCEGYDETKRDKKSYLMYLDANNLYGWAMSQKLPTDGLRWLTEEELMEADFTSIDPDADQGYILDVDLDYPTEVHELHNDYPLAPEKTEISEEMLSPFCKMIRTEEEAKAAKFPKLVPNLRNKRRYIIHSRQLRFYVELGMKLGKVHRGIVFNQSAWLEPYIQLNTDLRTKADIEFEKSLYKLMNNAVFGKTMENVRLHKDISLSTSEQQTRKLVASPRYQQCTVFNDSLAGIAMKKKFTRLNKPMYVGFSILELSKLLMYEFHYMHMLSKYGDRLKLLFTDTDSLMYEIFTDDIYADMAEDIHLYDTSDYHKEGPRSHLRSTTSKKVIGKMKDEMNGQPMEEFVGLKPKMYSFVCGGKEKKKAKGIKKSTVDSHMSFQQYKDCVLEHKRRSHGMNLFRSHLHEIYSIKMVKKSLTPYDNKRYITVDGIETLAYGHEKIDVLECVGSMIDTVDHTSL